MLRRWMVLTLLALAMLPAVAGAASIGIGAFGGLSVPLVQDDTGQGPQFGVRVPVSLLPLITVEPFFSSTSGGDKEQDIGGGLTATRSGFDVKGYGVNALLTMGGPVRFYPFAGIGSYKLSRTGSSDLTKTGYDFGLGLGFTPPIAHLSIDLRAELNAVVDGDASRKWGNLTAGVSYNVFHFPATP